VAQQSGDMADRLEAPRSRGEDFGAADLAGPVMDRQPARLASRHLEEGNSPRLVEGLAIGPSGAGSKPHLPATVGVGDQIDRRHDRTIHPAAETGIGIVPHSECGKSRMAGAAARRLTYTPLGYTGQGLGFSAKENILEAGTAPHHHAHQLDADPSALTATAISATLHCLTGCAIGEIAGMAIGTAVGLSSLATVALAVGLAFLFGYSLTSLPLLRAGFAIGAVIPIALASDTLSIATMEVVDNLIVLAVPGAMEAGLGSLLFWGSLSFALAIAAVVTVPLNRYLIARGKGHAVVHRTGVHGGPPVRAVAALTGLAFAFGTAVLVAEAIG